METTNNQHSAFSIQHRTSKRLVERSRHNVLSALAALPAGFMD
jgi:hypothetical protein